MKSKLSALLIAAYLVIGCSSGGGTSGAGGGGAVTTDEFLLTASLVIRIKVLISMFVRALNSPHSQGHLRFQSPILLT